MKSPVVRVRCYGCGRPQRRDVGCCERCGATFGALCGCGATISVYDDECPACRAPHVPNRVPASKLPHVRAARWAAFLLAAGLAGWITYQKLTDPGRTWEMKLQASRAYNAGDFETSFRLAREVTEQNPADAGAWYLLALSHRELKFPASTYVPLAEKALVSDPGHVEAREFLALAELELGHLDRAIEHATAATRVPSPKAADWLLLAKLELMRTPPNLLVVQDALEQAGAGGRDGDELKLLLADVAIRLQGGIGGGPERLPTQVAATLRAALAVLDARSPADVETSTNRARILIALGDADKAFGAAAAALAQFPAGSPPEATADVRILCAMALHARGNREEANAEFARVLFDRPDAATAGAVATFLSSADDALSARALLSVAAARNDPRGAVGAALATVLLEQGDFDEAAKAIVSARGASPGDAAFAEVLGTVRAAQGRFDEARAAYGDAIGLAPNLIGPRVRLALLPLAEARTGDPDPERCAQAAREVEELRTRFGDEPFLLEGLGRLRLAAGDAKGALVTLERAARRSPANPDVWLALAAARRGSGAETAIDDAAAALSRARRLRPNSSRIATAEAETWLAAGRPDVAVATCTEFLRLAPDDAGVLRLRARAYRDLGMWSVVAADLRRVDELGVADERDAIDRVDALHRAGDRAAALELTARLKARCSPDGLRLLAVIAALNEGDAETAIERLRESGPSLLLAEIQLGTGRGGEALGTLRALWEARRGDAPTARLLVATLLGPVPVAPERLAEARAVLAALPPEAPAGLRDLVAGRVLIAEGRPADAVDPLRAATRALPSDPLAWLFLGESLFLGGDRSESLAAFRKSAAIPGAHQPAIAAIAAERLFGASCGMRDPLRAEELALEALRLDARHVRAALRAAELLHARDEYVRAAEVVESELKVPGVAPEDSARLRLAAAIERLWSGDFTLAETHVDALPADLRESPAARLVLASAELAAGRPEEARKLLAAVLAADPDNAMAAFGLVRASVLRGAEGLTEAVARADAWCEAHPADRHLPVAAARLFASAGMRDAAVGILERCAARHPSDILVAGHLAATLKRVGRPNDAVARLAKFAAEAEGESAAAARLAAATIAVRCRIDTESALATSRALAADADVPPELRADAEVLVTEALLALDRPEEAERGAQALLERLAAAQVRGRRERALESRLNFVVGFVAATANPPRRAQAQEAYLRCTDIDRDNLDAANNLAYVMSLDASTAPRALQLARRVVADAPENPGYWDTLAEAARRCGAYSDAEAAWERSLALLADAAGAAARRRGRIALSYAKFLRDVKKAARADEVAAAARSGIAGTDEDRELARFLAERP